MAAWGRPELTAISDSDSGNFVHHDPLVLEIHSLLHAAMCTLSLSDSQNTEVENGLGSHLA